MHSPFDLSSLISPVLDGVVSALSDRVNQTEAERQAKADGALAVILSFQPRDVIDLTLAGQTVLFNEILADGARDVLRGMVEAAKQRRHSSLVGMGRVIHGYLDRLERRAIEPHRTEIVPQAGVDAIQTAARPDAEAAPRAVAVARPPDAVTAEPPVAAAAIPIAVTSGEDDGVGGGLPTGEPVVETSWLDEPYEQWIVETPADLDAWNGAEAAEEAPPDTIASGRDDAARQERPDAARDFEEPALPRRIAGYAPARVLEDAAAGD